MLAVYMLTLVWYVIVIEVKFVVQQHNILEIICFFLQML